MQFWLAFGISEEFERGGGSSVTVLQPGLASFGDAIDSLAEVTAPVVAGRVTEANAYVVQADTLQEASMSMRAVFIEHQASPRVKLVQRDVRTARAPALPAEIEALNHVHGELCITHQLTELALTRVTTEGQRAQLDRHRLALEDLGYAVRVMRGDDVTTTTAGDSGSARLGYGNGQIADSERYTLAESLEALVTELSIARHQVDIARQRVPPSHQQELRDLSLELDRFGETVETMRHQVPSPD